MADKTLNDAFLDELRDVYNAEQQILKALPTLAKTADDGILAQLLDAHLKETRGQVERLESAFFLLDEKARGQHCSGMEGILEEGKSAMEEEFDVETMDAVLIASARRVEHYEMAAYRSLISWASELGHADVAVLLKQNLAEEESADQKLAGLAAGGINRAAAEASRRAVPAADPALSSRLRRA